MLLLLLLLLALLLAQRHDELHSLDDILGLRPVRVDERACAVLRAGSIAVIVVRATVVVAVKVAVISIDVVGHARPPQAGFLLQRGEPLPVGAGLEHVRGAEAGGIVGRVWRVVVAPRQVPVPAAGAVHGRLLDQVLGRRLVDQAPAAARGVDSAVIAALEDGRAVCPEGLVRRRARRARRRHRVGRRGARRARLLLEYRRPDRHGAGPAVLCPHDADLVPREELLVAAVGSRCPEEAERWDRRYDDCDVGLH